MPNQAASSFLVGEIFWHRFLNLTMLGYYCWDNGSSLKKRRKALLSAASG